MAPNALKSAGFRPLLGRNGPEVRQQAHLERATLGQRMSGPADQFTPADEQTAIQLIRRLVTEYGARALEELCGRLRAHGDRGGLHGACAYLMGNVVNEAYVDRSFPGIVSLGLLTMAIFAIKGAASYGQAVMLSRIGNRIIAENQRRMFDRLMHQNLGFFADAAFVGIPGAAFDRRQRRDAGAQSAGHRDRPRSPLADRACRRDGRCRIRSCRCSRS